MSPVNFGHLAFIEIASLCVSYDKVVLYSYFLSPSPLFQSNMELLSTFNLAHLCNNC